MERGCGWTIVLGLIVLIAAIMVIIGGNILYALTPLLIPLVILGIVFVLFVIGVLTGKVTH